MGRLPKPTWQGVFYTAGLVTLGVIVTRFALGLPMPAATTQSLLALTAALLGIPSAFRRKGGDDK